MKVMAFNARPDERAFFDHFSQSLDMDLTLQKDTLTLDNVALTRGYDGISCTCDLPAPILEKLAENGVRYVALRTIGYDNVDLKAAERLGIRVLRARPARSGWGRQPRAGVRDPPRDRELRLRGRRLRDGLPASGGWRYAHPRVVVGGLPS